MPTTYAIPNGRTAMDATTYTANGGVQTVTNIDNGTTGFKPDFWWGKTRANAGGNYFVDSVRGVSKLLQSQSTAAETTDATYVTAFNTNGFSLGTGNYPSGNTMVAWQWVAGQGVNNTNTVGSITSTVSANTTTGFSIVTYTGNGTVGATVGHGLGVAPSLIILKHNNGPDNWQVYHASLGNTKGISLNLSNIADTSSNWWNNTSPTSNVFSTASYTNQGGSYTYVAYCWSEVPGFSQFGSYTGNGSADGPFVYLGFRPRFVMIKRTDTTADWALCDSTRNPNNKVTGILFPNASSAEATADIFYFLSNGFKLNQTGGGANASGGTYIYAAFAENPFKYANAY